jgi:hypothetical protein
VVRRSTRPIAAHACGNKQPILNLRDSLPSVRNAWDETCAKWRVSRQENSARQSALTAIEPMRIRKLVLFRCYRFLENYDE